MLPSSVSRNSYWDSCDISTFQGTDSTSLSFKIPGSLPPVAVWPWLNYCTTGLQGPHLGGGEGCRSKGQMVQGREADRTGQVREREGGFQAFGAWIVVGCPAAQGIPARSLRKPFQKPKSNQEPSEHLVQTSPALAEQVGWSYGSFLRFAPFLKPQGTMAYSRCHDARHPHCDLTPVHVHAHAGSQMCTSLLLTPGAQPNG